MDLKITGIAGTVESGDILIELSGKETPGPGIEIDLESTVENQFGKQIRKVITETVESFGVESAFVHAVDKGALDCTIRARVTSAVYRACGNDAYIFE